MQQGIECARWFNNETNKGFIVFEFTKEEFEKYLNESEALDDEKRSRN